MKILVTAFEPFGEDKYNPTMEVVAALKGLKGVDTKILPVTFSCFNILKDEFENKEYDYILHLGQAGGRSKINFEQVGINLIDAIIPDNDGLQPQGQPIVEMGEDGIFTTLPIRELVSSLKDEGLPVSISYSAGTYVCNYIMYSSLHYFKGTNTKVGFIHIPYSPVQVINRDASSMDTQIVVKTIKSTIQMLKGEKLKQRTALFGEIQ